MDRSPTGATNLYYAPRRSTLQFINYDTQSVMRCWYDGHICRMCSVQHVHGGDGTRFTLLFICELSLL